jgi:hypothetical protein
MDEEAAFAIAVECPGSPVAVLLTEKVIDKPLFMKLTSPGADDRVWPIASSQVPVT